jgi:putative phage-type endonuclease
MLKTIDKDYKEMYNLKEIDDISEVEFTDEEDWLEKRRYTIGGSEIGIILGLNEYSSKLQLYKSKKDNFKRPDSVYTRKGKELENLIFTNYVVPYFESKGYSVCKPNKLFVRTSTHWLSANLDGLAVPCDRTFATAEDNVVVEIKWVSQFGTQKWDVSEEYGNIPASYYAQVQQYMYHTGARNAVVFAMFDDTWTCERYEIKRNDSFIRKLLIESETFYRTHLEMDIPPKADIRFDSADIAKLIAEKAETPVKKSEEYDLLLSKYKALKASEKDLTDELKTTLNEILEKHLEGYVPDKVAIKFTCAKRTTTTIDSKKLKELYPEAAEQCSKTTEYTWTSVR